MKIALKIFGWFFLLLFVLVGAVFGLLCMTSVNLPNGMVDRLCAEISSSNCLVRVGAIDCRLPHRIVVRDLRVFSAGEPDVKPVLSAARLEVTLAFGRLPWRLGRLVKSVTIDDLSYPRLPKGYYIPDSIEFPGSPDFQEKNEPVNLSFPEIAPFKLTLNRPRILAVTPTRVTFDAVYATHKKLVFSDADIKWPDRDTAMSLTGEFGVDAARACVKGRVNGQARQGNIRPMLGWGALEITNCWQFIDAFTGVTVPVDAGCAFDVNLRNNDLHIFLDLHPTGGAYRGVPFKTADGCLDIRVFVRDTYQNARIAVGPLVANLEKGTMSGTVIYENTNDVPYVTFNVDSNTTLSNALAIANCFNDGTLDCIQPETIPHVTLKGRLAGDPAYMSANDLAGTISFARGHFFSIPLMQASTTFGVKGGEVTFENGRASGPRGGEIKGTGHIHASPEGLSAGSFDVDLDCRNLLFVDLAEAFAYDAGDRHGLISGTLSLSGPLGQKDVRTLKGHGHISCQDGHLARLNLFAGLTSWMAKHVPGVESLVNQSTGSCDFALTNGVLSTSNLELKGNVFSITGRGAYDMHKDDLDFRVRLEFFNGDSFISLLAKPITWPFSKFLLEFHLYGPLSNPKWTYSPGGYK